MKESARAEGTQFVKELPKGINELGSFIREQRSSARLSLRRLSELAGISRHKFAELLGERGIPRHYTEQELAQDLEYARG